MASETEGSPLPSVKDLASSEPSLRRKALLNILSHLSSRPPTSFLTSIQSLQLWRAFSVTLYMHDSKSAISVQNLIKTLASTFEMMYNKDIELLQQQPSQSTPKSRSKSKVKQSTTTNGNISSPSNTQLPQIQPQWLSQWHTSFWTLISQEWSGIDSHRINKYLLLVRFVVRTLFKLLLTFTKTPASSSLPTTSPDLVETQIEILKTFPLSARNSKVPDGLKLHVLDIWVEEIETAMNESKTTELFTTTNPTTPSRIDSQQTEPHGEGSGTKRKRVSSKSQAQDNTQDSTVQKATIDVVEDQEKRSRELAEKLMQPVQILTKEAISKGVKIRAREAVAAFEELGISSG